MGFTPWETQGQPFYEEKTVTYKNEKRKKVTDTYKVNLYPAYNSISYDKEDSLVIDEENGLWYGSLDGRVNWWIGLMQEKRVNWYVGFERSDKGVNVKTNFDFTTGLRGKKGEISNISWFKVTDGKGQQVKVHLGEEILVVRKEEAVVRSRSRKHKKKDVDHGKEEKSEEKPPFELIIAMKVALKDRPWTILKVMEITVVAPMPAKEMEEVLPTRSYYGLKGDSVQVNGKLVEGQDRWWEVNDDLIVYPHFKSDSEMWLHSDLLTADGEAFKDTAHVTIVNDLMIVDGVVLVYVLRDTWQPVVGNQLRLNGRIKKVAFVMHIKDVRSHAKAQFDRNKLVSSSEEDFAKLFGHLGYGIIQIRIQEQP